MDDQPGELSFFAGADKDPLAKRPDESATDHALFCDWVSLPADIQESDSRAAKNLRVPLDHLRFLRKTRHWDARQDAAMALDVTEWRQGNWTRIEASFNRLLSRCDGISDVLASWIKWAINHPDQLPAKDVAHMLAEWRETVLALRPVQDPPSSPRTIGRSTTVTMSEAEFAKSLKASPTDALVNALAVLTRPAETTPDSDQTP